MADNAPRQRRRSGVRFEGMNIISVYEDEEGDDQQGDDQGDQKMNDNHNHHRNLQGGIGVGQNNHNQQGGIGVGQINQSAAPSISASWDQWSAVCNATIQDMSSAVVSVCQSLNVDASIAEMASENKMIMVQVWSEVEFVWKSLESLLLVRVLKGESNWEQWTTDRHRALYTASASNEIDHVQELVLNILTTLVSLKANEYMESFRNFQQVIWRECIQGIRLGGFCVDSSQVLDLLNHWSDYGDRATGMIQEMYDRIVTLWTDVWVSTMIDDGMRRAKAQVLHALQHKMQFDRLRWKGILFKLINESNNQRQQPPQQQQQAAAQPPPQQQQEQQQAAAQPPPQQQ